MDQSGPPLLHSRLIHLPPSKVFIYIQEFHTHQDMKRISIRYLVCRGGTFRLIALLFYYYLHFGKCQSAMRDVKLPTLYGAIGSQETNVGVICLHRTSHSRNLFTSTKSKDLVLIVGYIKYRWALYSYIYKAAAGCA